MAISLFPFEEAKWAENLVWKGRPAPVILVDRSVNINRRHSFIYTDYALIRHAHVPMLETAISWHQKGEGYSVPPLN